MENRLSSFTKRKIDPETSTTVAYVQFDGHNRAVSKINEKWQFINAALPELTEGEQEWLDMNDDKYSTE